MLLLGVDFYIVPSKGIKNLIKRFFRMIDLEEACQYYHVSFEEVKKALEEKIKDAPSDYMVVYFSKGENEPVKFKIQEMCSFLNYGP